MKVRLLSITEIQQKEGGWYEEAHYSSSRYDVGW
jgi:hypothetical protein